MKLGCRIFRHEARAVSLGTSVDSRYGVPSANKGAAGGQSDVAEVECWLVPTCMTRTDSCLSLFLLNKQAFNEALSFIGWLILY